MKTIDKNTSPFGFTQKTIPFDRVEDVWFWFIAAQQAKNDGARYVAGASTVPRPCEPLDILNILDRLYRQRRLVRDHLLVLRHYGRRNMAPDPDRIKERRAYSLWNEALDRMTPPLMKKGILCTRTREPHSGWQKQALVVGQEYAVREYS